MAKKISKAKTKRAASLVIHAPGKMTKQGRKDIALWLRRHAEHLMRHGPNYTTGRFTAGYHY